MEFDPRQPFLDGAELSDRIAPHLIGETTGKTNPVEGVLPGSIQKVL